MLAFASPAAALEQKLTAADGAASDALGSSVAIDGDTIVLGAPGDGAGRGAVYVFQRSGDSWTNTAKLTASDGDTGDNLGSSVALDGDTIIAGAESRKVGSHAFQGAAYTFASAGAAARTQTAELTASDGAANDHLSSSVAIDGDTIVAGAPTDDGGSPGATYTFARTGAPTRTETAKLTATDGRAFQLGSSVGVDGDTIVAGAPGANNGRARSTCSRVPAQRRAHRPAS
jgi:hypothetical protein